MDWYPTLATLAGIEVPADRAIDGRDISSLLRGETDFVPTPNNSEMLRKLRGMAILFHEEMRRDARPAGEVSPPRADGNTEIPQALLDRLDARLGVTYARYGDRTLEMDLYRPRGSWGTLPAA